MEKKDVLEILHRIHGCLSYGKVDIAKEYLELEIENLQGITPKKCKNTIYKFNYCDKCQNLNCPDNRNEILRHNK